MEPPEIPFPFVQSSRSGQCRITEGRVHLTAGLQVTSSEHYQKQRQVGVHHRSLKEPTKDHSINYKLMRKLYKGHVATLGSETLHEQPGGQSWGSSQLYGGTLFRTAIEKACHVEL